MPDVKEVVNGLEMSYKYSNVDENNTLVPQWIVLHAIALLKEQEPVVMTENDMREAEPGTVIFCEQRDEVRTYLTPMIKYDDGVFENRFLGAEPEAAQLANTRFWTSCPTDEQRKKEPWDGQA